MSILWCGGEDVDFPVFTGCWMSSGPRRAGYDRCSISISSAAAAKSAPFPGGAVTSAWLSFRYYAGYPHANDCFCGLGASATASSGLYVGLDSATATKIALWKYNGTTWTQLASETGTSLTDGKIHMELINYGANAIVRVYFNSVLIITYEGDVTVAGVTNVDSVFLGPVAIVIYITEIIVSTTDTRNMSLVTTYPSAAGDTLDWTGAYTTVDEDTINDADVAYDNTDGHQALYNLSNLPAGNFSVLAMKEVVRACKSSDSTPTRLNLGIKSGGTVDVADTKTLTTSWASYERYMAVNPVTGVAFTPAEIDALQLCLESEA